jgi:histidinol-phosphate aminotransferase
MNRRTLLQVGAAMGLGSGPWAISRPSSAEARLSLNENAFGCSPLAIEAIRRELTNLTRYTESEADVLTAQIAAKEGVLASQIVLGEVLPALGVQLGLDGGAGGEFLYSQPGFTELVLAAAQTGGRAIGVDLNSRLENDLPAFEARLNEHTRAVFIVNPHNPSGTVNDNNELRSFVREAARRTLVIIDEAYLEYTDDFAERSLVDRVRAGENVVVFRTFAKIYGLASLQLGYAIAPVKLADSLYKRGLGAPHSLNRLAVVAAAAALKDSAFIAHTKRKTTYERNRWHKALDELRLRRAEARGNFVFFESGRPQNELAGAFLKHGIHIGRPFPPLDRWARISIGRPDQNEHAIALLRKILSAGSLN